MTAALSCFLSGVVILTIIKFNMFKRDKPTPLYDGLFLMIMIICMYFINSATMKSRCGSVNITQVLIATLPPWILMYGTVVAVLYLFPGWKQPFSNTFGYAISLFASGSHYLKPVLPDTDAIEAIFDNPSLLINQFSLTNFDQIITRLNFKTTEPDLTNFKNIILLKELTAELVWHILIGLVVLTVSYNIIINYKCTIVNTAPPPTPPPTSTREYSI